MGGRSSSSAGFATRSTGARVGAGRNSAPRTTGSGWGAFSRASTRSAARGSFVIDRGSTGACSGGETMDYLLEEGWIPPHLEPAYESVARRCADRSSRQRFAEATPYRTLRLHGDCHPGNVLWTDDGPAFRRPRRLHDGARDAGPVDAAVRAARGDGACSSATCSRATREFADFDHHEISLIEPLRTLRIMHYAGWLARRWDDPAFPRAFPWFEEPKYWEQHVLNLREQISAMEEPPLAGLGDIAPGRGTPRPSGHSVPGHGERLLSFAACPVNPRHRRRRLHRQSRRPPARRARRTRGGSRQPLHRLSQRRARRAAGRRRHGRSRRRRRACCRSTPSRR